GSPLLYSLDGLTGKMMLSILLCPLDVPLYIPINGNGHAWSERGRLKMDALTNASRGRPSD
ncbi:hypothetical protein SK128_000538, partial [Halocaridina rubra]